MNPTPENVYKRQSEKLFNVYNEYYESNLNIRKKFSPAIPTEQRIE